MFGAICLNGIKLAPAFSCAPCPSDQLHSLCSDSDPDIKIRYNKKLSMHIHTAVIYLHPFCII